MTIFIILTRVWRRTERKEMEDSGDGRIGVFAEQRAKRGTPGVRTERTLEGKAVKYVIASA